MIDKAYTTEAILFLFFMVAGFVSAEVRAMPAAAVCFFAIALDVIAFVATLIWQVWK